MRRAVIILLFLLTCTGAAAQNELPEPQIGYDSLVFDEFMPLPPMPPMTPLLSNPFSSRTFPALSFPALPDGLWRFSPGGTALARPFEFTMPDAALFISYDRYRRQEGIAIPAASVNAPRMVLSNRGYMPLVAGGDHTLGLVGSRQRFPSMGFSNSLSVGYSWEATDGITLYGNVRASDNMYHLTRFKDFGVSGRARVRVADGVWLNGYGNYTIYNGAGPQQLPPGMFPTNSFGGTIEVKITDKFGIEGGVMREYDPFSRRWVTNPYASPVFY